MDYLSKISFHYQIFDDNESQRAYKQLQDKSTGGSINPNDLAGKITEFCNNREVLVEKGKASSDFVQTYHNPIESAKKVIERYKAVLDG